MTGTILTYLREYSGKTFGEVPFNHVDALILCQLSYLKYDGMVPDVNDRLGSIPLKAIGASPKADSLFSDERYEKVNRQLFELLLESRRYADLKLNCYVNLVEEELESQFAAILFFPGDNITFLAFRGTDETIVGWKEDFHMAYLCPVPAQRKAEKYVRLVMERFPGSFLVGGHSKGGNLAIYSVMVQQKSIQDRIETIFCMDGPGFRKDILDKYGYEKIAGKVVKWLPRSSLIGMLYEQNTSCRIVESRAAGLLQHDPYSWIVRGDHFVEAKELEEGRRFVDDTINEWLLALPKEELESVIDTIFQVLEAPKVNDVMGLWQEKSKNLKRMLGALKGMEPEQIDQVIKAIKELLEIAGNRAVKEIEQKIKNLGVSGE